MLLALLACSPPRATVEAPDPSFIEVTIDEANVGSAEAPLPFPTQPETWTISLRTLDSAQSPYPLTGDLKLSARPGRVVGDPIIKVVDGEWAGDVLIEHAFGPTRIWASDVGDEDVDSGRVASWATGVTEPIWYEKPTIAQMQATSDPETNAIDGEYAEILVEGRQVVVTALTTNGFWVSDILDEPGSGNSLFVYTFSKPGDEYVPGASIALLNGIDQEYLATTQLYWPTIEAGDATYPVPDAIALDPSFACDQDAMEGLESSRVEALGWQVPADFTESSEDYADYLDYGQWPLVSGNCTIYVESAGAAPDFSPLDFAGQALPRVSGMAKQVFSKAILSVIDGDDLESPASGPRSKPPERAPGATPPSPHARADWLR